MLDKKVFDEVVELARNGELIDGFEHQGYELNRDKKHVEMIIEGLNKKDGYCPCRVQRNEDTRCICKEFREQIADPDFEGYCHCLLYYKEK